MGASFSWDWGPAFPTQGIWKPLELEAYDSTLLRSVSVETSPNGTTWQLKATVHVEMTSAEAQGELEILLDGHQLNKISYSIKAISNEGAVHLSILIPESLKIEPWYPNGVGAQTLYNLTIKMTSTNEEPQTKSIKIGFRSIKVLQDRLSSKTEAYGFVFSVNDRPFWAKGSNWIPAHVLSESIAEGYLHQLLHSAKLANMNMLRIWGGGIYEDEALYQAADEYGIMLWHDMMFACSLYETDETFLNSVKVEIKQQIRRLQHHPSIAIWAGIRGA